MPTVPAQNSQRRDERVGPWHLWMRSELGLVRQRVEDAWVILPEVPWRGAPGGAWGIFDGLGGLPHGAEAAWAAADNLRTVLAKAKGPDEVLAALNPHVLATRGATTAVILWAPLRAEDPRLSLFSVGDSAAYEIHPSGSVRLLNEKDAATHNVVTDFLGNLSLEGHYYEFEPERAATLLLCSDGVDGVIAIEALQALGRATNPSAALDGLYDDIFDQGAPDNATSIVARRIP